MQNLYFGYLQTTTGGGLYNNDTGEAIKVNIHVCNTHTAGIVTGIGISALVSLDRPVGSYIIKETLAAGGRITLTDVVLNAGQTLEGYAETADKVTVRIDNP